jgi:hypothetical protein
MGTNENGSQIDTIHHHVRFRFGWLDRLRILLGREAHYHVRLAYFDNKIARALDNSIHVDRVLPQKPVVMTLKEGRREAADA